MQGDNYETHLDLTLLAPKGTLNNPFELQKIITSATC